MSQVCIDMEEVTCGECGVVWTIPARLGRALRESHETFYCPNGHMRAWRGKSDHEKQLARLEQRIAWERESTRDANRLGRQVLDALRTCPVCGWQSRKTTRTWTPWYVGQAVGRIQQDMLAHMIESHGTPIGQIEELTGEVVNT